LCQSAQFQRWVISRVGAAPQGVKANQHAAQFVRDVCGVTSRAQLDHVASAATLFHEAVRKPYLRWSGKYVG
jgi:hypothetical protein